jgi:hypothetical protein
MHVDVRGKWLLVEGPTDPLGHAFDSSNGLALGLLTLNQ